MNDEDIENFREVATLAMPVKFFLRSDLSLEELTLYGIVHALQACGRPFTRRDIANIMEVSDERVTDMVHQLVANGFFKSEEDGSGRYISTDVPQSLRCPDDVFERVYGIRPPRPN